MALDPEKELYILAIYDDFSKYSAPKGFFLNQCFSFFFLHDFKYIKNIFWGKMLVPINIQPVLHVLNLGTYLFPKNLTIVT